MSPRKVRPVEPDPYAELRSAVGLEPRIDLGNNAAITGQMRLDTTEREREEASDA